MRLVAAGLAALALLAGGCGEAAKFNATDLSAADWGRDFALVDHAGKPRRLGDFRGKVVVLFFGYTQCPDVCPTTLSAMREVMDRLGGEAAGVQMLFVSVDPERDTQTLLAEYVPSFHPSFLGLRGDAAATAEAAREFKVFYNKQPAKTPGSYAVDHTAGSYAIDAKGKLRLYFRHGETPERMVEDLRKLLAAR